MNDEALLIAIGAAVVLGGLSFGKLTEPVSDVTRNISPAIGSAFKDPISWFIPDFLEDDLDRWAARL